jgi:hypothetical protein
MKKRLLLLLILPGAANAQFTYTTSGGKVTITGYTGTGGAVTIPDTTNGLPVTAIADGAFVQSTSLTSVPMGTNVTSIGNRSFQRCTGLTGVTIGNRVTTIGAGTFQVCTSLTGITIPGSVTTIGNSPFQNCTSLATMTVDALNSSYAREAGVLFNKQETLPIQYPGGNVGDYTVPKSVTNIGAESFSFCSGLTSVTIPNTVTSIGEAAFRFSSSITSIDPQQLDQHRERGVRELRRPGRLYDHERHYQHRGLCIR